MRLNLLPLLLAPLVLAACDSPRLMPGGATISSFPSAQGFSFVGPYSSIFLETEPAAEAIRSQVDHVVFVVGDKTFPANRTPDLTKPHSYYWFTSNPCEELPQGDTLPLKYEMLDANNAVVQQASTTVDIQTCR
ncbi:hypothetical protein SU48_02805 [Deinococcus puniceus]|uniref:Lipoprotein n=1 Tax=Deinococcus puniceus TaxID=1182568 RepID=A0A172T7B0_9DEIO|nr:hypothetical protein SU48_02805 [Deinococcus puniceus]